MWQFVGGATTKAVTLLAAMAIPKAHAVLQETTFADIDATASVLAPTMLQTLSLRQDAHLDAAQQPGPPGPPGGQGAIGPPGPPGEQGDVLPGPEVDVECGPGELKFTLILEDRSDNGWQGAEITFDGCEGNSHVVRTLESGSYSAEFICFPETEASITVTNGDAPDDVWWVLFDPAGNSLQGGAPYNHNFCEDEPEPTEEPPVLPPGAPGAAGSPGPIGPPGPPGAPGPAQCGDWDVWYVTLTGPEESGWGGAEFQIKYCSGEVMWRVTLEAGSAYKQAGFCMPPDGSHGSMEVTSGTHPNLVHWTLCDDTGSTGSGCEEGSAPYNFGSTCDGSPSPPPDDGSPTPSPGPPSPSPDDGSPTPSPGPPSPSPDDGAPTPSPGPPSPPPDDGAPEGPPGAAGAAGQRGPPGPPGSPGPADCGSLNPPGTPGSWWPVTLTMESTGLGWGGAVANLKYCSEEIFGTYSLPEDSNLREVELCLPAAGFIFEVTSGESDDYVAWDISHDGEQQASGGAPFTSDNCGSDSGTAEDD